MVGTEQFIQPVSGVVTPPTSSSFTTNQKVVAVSGTAEQLQSQAIAEGFYVVVKAMTANTGLVYIGDTQANADKASGVNFAISAGSAISLGVPNTNLIWIDVDNNGEGVEWIVET